jgi:anti-anti-sigma factor
MSEPTHLTCTSEQGVLVFTLTTPQIQGDALADALRQELLDAVVQTAATKVVIDFRNVEYLGSAGFRPLLSLYRKLQQGGGRMLFCNLAPEVAGVLLSTRLITTSRSTVAPFEMAADLPAALASLNS